MYSLFLYYKYPQYLSIMQNLIDDRQIRVFISSTFRDMQDERGYLINRVFPKLRILAARRDVTLTEVDLRWGITEEESKSGKVVEICFREIENSIPFFIGIIGNRYGWVPKKKDLSGNVTERYSDVNKYLNQGLSVTEMEMQFGVLSREEDMHAYFYIKEQEEDADNPEMLSRLKEEVRKSKYPSSTYSSPEDLAIQVEEAFTALLDEVFPNGKLTELEKERIGQRSFMNQLCQNYIKDEKNFKALDAWLADGDSHQFVLTGASGLGKSALIANWLKEKLSDCTRDYNIIYHFTGNGGSESNKEHITKCLAAELCEQYGWKSNENGEVPKLNDLFDRVSSEEKSLLIVIDAINQILDNAGNAKLLNWLPSPGKNIKIMFSTLENDRTMEVFKNRDYPIYTLEPLDIESRSLLVCTYLKNQYGKSLTNEQVNRIVSDKQCENTLVLRTLLDELIKFGIHEKLDERIEYYLAQDTIDDFYKALLSAYEKEYKEYGKNFVKTILSLIAVSKDGLAEDEIITIANIKKRLAWSQFRCAFDKMLCVKNGKISFSHTYIRNAVERRYQLSKPNCGYRCDLINYFGPDKKDNWRPLIECMYQLLKLNTKEWAKYLYNHLRYPGTTAIIYMGDESLCRSCWLYLRSLGYTFDCFVQCKDDLIQSNNYIENQRFIQRLRGFLHSLGEYSISLALEKEFLNTIESMQDVPDTSLVKAYNDLAFEYTTAANETSSQNEFDSYVKTAAEYYNKAIELAKQCSKTELAVAYNGFAVLCHYCKLNAEAIKMANKALKIDLEHFGTYHNETSVCYNTLAMAYLGLNDYDKAIECSKKNLEITQVLYGTTSNELINAYYNLSKMLLSCERCEEALTTINIALKIIEKLYGKDYPDMDSYINMRTNIEDSIRNKR